MRVGYRIHVTAGSMTGGHRPPRAVPERPLNTGQGALADGHNISPFKYSHNGAVDGSVSQIATLSQVQLLAEMVVPREPRCWVCR